MHQRIVTTVAQLRQDLARHLDEKAIHEICRRAGHRWRKCLLTPVATIHWFIIQVLHGNTALDHISLLADRAFTGAAYCLARANLPLEVFQAVLRNLIKALVPETKAAALWLDRHRTFLVDGSGFSMPDTPELQSYFGQLGNQKLGCGFPVASIVAMFHAGTGFLLEVVTAALRTSEMALLGPIHTALSPMFCPFLLLGQRDLHGGGTCRFVRGALACGTQSETLETDNEDGCFEVYDCRGRAEGAHGLCDRLQSSARGDERSGRPPRCRRRADQLHRRVALALRAQSRRTVGAGGQPVLSWPGRAPSKKAALEEVSGHEEAKIRIAQALDGRRRCRLT